MATSFLSGRALFVLLLLVITVVVARQVWLFRDRLGALRDVSFSRKPFEAHPAQPRLRFLILGDSTAVGTGSTDPRTSVAGRLAADFPDADITTLGKNGRRTAEVLPLLAPFAGQRFDLVLLQIGGNDILRVTPLRPLRDDLQTLLRTARTLSDRVVVITAGNVGLAPIFPRPIGWFYSARTRAVQQIFREVTSAEGVLYVDLYKERHDDTFATDPLRYYAPDFLHPSGDGYGVWHQQIRRALDTTGLTAR